MRVNKYFAHSKSLSISITVVEWDCVVTGDTCLGSAFYSWEM